MEIQPQQTTTWIDKDSDYNFAALQNNDDSSSTTATRVMPGRDYELHVIELPSTDNGTILHHDVIDEDSSPTSTNSSNSSSNSDIPYRRRKDTRNATPLIEWLEMHQSNPYPTKSEKQQLAIYSKLTVRQLNDWFANARRNIKRHGYSEWRKKKNAIGFTKYSKSSPNVVVSIEDASIVPQKSKKRKTRPLVINTEESSTNNSTTVSYIPPQGYYEASDQSLSTSLFPPPPPPPSSHLSLTSNSQGGETSTTNNNNNNGLIKPITSNNNNNNSGQGATYQFFTMSHQPPYPPTKNALPLATTYHPAMLPHHAIYQYPFFTDHHSVSGTTPNTSTSWDHYTKGSPHIINYYTPAGGPTGTLWPHPPLHSTAASQPPIVGTPLVHYGENRASTPTDGANTWSMGGGLHGNNTSSTTGGTGTGIGQVYFEGAMIKSTPTR